MNSFFLCPVCGGALAVSSSSLTCAAGHCFDRARQGYVNLLRSQQSGKKRHGDDRRMALARRAFLDRGYYQPLLDTLLPLVLSHTPSGGRVLDAGCGECWYTQAAQKALCGAGRRAVLAGVDISRETLIAGAKRWMGQDCLPAPELAVASVFAIPAATGSCDVILNFFAPLAAAEFARVLVPGGVLLRAVPRAFHLQELKAAVYDTPRENSPPPAAVPGFTLAADIPVRYTLRLDDPAAIGDLFMMTPYYYKTSRDGQARAAALTALTTTVDFSVMLYRAR